MIVRKGPNMGARFLLDSESTVAGRNPKSEIFLDDVTVSRKHATFVRGEGGFLVCGDEADGFAVSVGVDGMGEGEHFGAGGA